MLVRSVLRKGRLAILVGLVAGTGACKDPSVVVDDGQLLWVSSKQDALVYLANRWSGGVFDVMVKSLPGGSARRLWQSPQSTLVRFSGDTGWGITVDTNFCFWTPQLGDPWCRPITASPRASTPDGRFEVFWDGAVSGSGNGTLELVAFDACTSGSCTPIILVESIPNGSVILSNDGHYALHSAQAFANGPGSTVTLIDLTKPSAQQLVQLPTNHDVSTVAFSKDGSLVVLAAEWPSTPTFATGEVTLYQTSNGAQLPWPFPSVAGSPAFLEDDSVVVAFAPPDWTSPVEIYRVTASAATVVATSSGAADTYHFKILGGRYLLQSDYNDGSLKVLDLLTPNSAEVTLSTTLDRGWSLLEGEANDSLTRIAFYEKENVGLASLPVGTRMATLPWREPAQLVAGSRFLFGADASSFAYVDAECASEYDGTLHLWDGASEQTLGGIVTSTAIAPSPDTIYFTQLHGGPFTLSALPTGMIRKLPLR